MQKKPDTLPLISGLKGNKISFLCTIGIGAMATVPFYIILAYMNPMLLTKGQVVASSMMLISGLMSVICVISLPLMGYLSDEIGQSNLMIYAAVLIIIFAYLFDRKSNVCTPVTNKQLVCRILHERKNDSSGIQ